MEQPSSNLFEGYKTVGLVTGPLPFIIRHAKNPQDTRIITIVGKTFHTYTTNLTLVEASITHEYDIRTIMSDSRHIFCASGRSILSWGRGSKTLISRFDNGHQANVKLICKFGPKRFLSVDEDNSLFNWNTDDKEILNIISFDEGTFAITALCHPMKYKDKALIGSKQGSLQLWNVINEQCIYKFKGWDSAVVSLAQAPVEDVLGIGLADGHIHIHNIKFDETVVKIYQEYGRVTSMSFRFDQNPYLVTASEQGHLMIWNLEKKRLSSQIRNAHSGLISKCQFIMNESLLVTSGSDNTLKVWTLDSADGDGTLLYQRAGHQEPPSFIRFYGSKGFNLLSAGKDSTMKMFHIYSERLNRNLGTARMNSKSRSKNNVMQKLPPIVCFAAESSKEKRWDSIAACHQGSNLVTFWNYDKCKMGEHIIFQPSFNKNEVHASSICITCCGNFVLIGFTNGFIFKYNMQSGIFRGSYESGSVGERRAHDGSVTGLMVDALDILLISGGLDSIMKLWNFKTGMLLSEFVCPSAIIRLELHKENNLIAIALTNYDIEIRDLETRELVRRFCGKFPILDMTFSPDSRWLIVSYEDKSIRTWDLQLGKLIDSFCLSSPCTSLSISSTGEFLATSHKDSLGISIWSNYTIYCQTALKAINPDAKPALLDMPFVRTDELEVEDNESEDRTLPALQEPTEITYVSPEQLHETLLTLSGLPSSRWKNLLNLEEIREKQLIQEKEKRVKPVKVPFFIPVRDGLNPILDGDAIKKLNERTSDRSLRSTSRLQDLRLLSPVAQTLIKCGDINDFSVFLKQLKELGPSATDAEIRSFGSDTCGDNMVMLCFCNAVLYCLKHNLDYDLTCSWIALFLKAHSSLIQSDLEVQRKCLEMLNQFNWNRLDEKFNQIFTVLNFVRSSIL